jgi:DNA processing protein
LAGGGRTLAFVGCGLDVKYPRDHDGLFTRIAAQGALLSEYPMGAQPEAWRFPARNRLISGMAQGVVVVEAPASSGALNTAHHALEQGKSVMAVPGNIDRPGSAGCNQLLKDGALLITDVEDVLRGLGMVTLPARREHQQTLSFQENGNAEGEMPGGRGPSQRESLLASTRARFSETQRKLLDCLSLTPRHLDAVAQEAGVTAVQAGGEIVLLELSGAVQRLPGNAYIRLL